MSMESQMNAILRLLAADQESTRAAARQEIQSLLALAPRSRTAEHYIRKLLLELGAPDRLSGHAYTVEALLLIVEDRAYIRSITFGLYPQVAAKFDTTAARVERAIRHMIEVMWTRADREPLDRYFGSTISPERGKPTNGEFLARLANIVREQMDDAA